QDPIVVVGRVAQATDVDLRAMRQNPARVGVCAESPFTMIFAHPRVSDAAEWQIVNRRLKGAVVNVGIARTRRAQDLFGYSAVLGEQIQTQRAGTCVNELDHFLNAIDFQDWQDRAEDFLLHRRSVRRNVRQDGWSDETLLSPLLDDVQSRTASEP